MTVILRDHLRVLRYAVLSALADLRAIYTWRSWTFIWMVRILCQVSLFALLGRLLDAPDKVGYLIVGNSVFMVANTAIQVVNSTSWERLLGTLPLLVASPTGPFTVFAGRSALWLLDGIGVGTLSLFLLSPVFGVPLPMPTALLAVPLIVLVGVSTYCFGLLLGALALRTVSLRALIASLGGLCLMVLTGVQVPTTFWPAPVSWLAEVLPLTHGLKAVRDLLAHGPTAGVARLAVTETVIAAGWLLVAALAFWQYDRSGRHEASVDFSED
ncbi:ABC-2 type transport system permease protein [Micromonospora pallida]|uniref:ABC-2 type transport system permease protein n=1 Tax=Micromonospora pallida TaxID=145854 RepID=A0A1C6S9N2_9ACTN|nr:ABC transporter permease [Micromonospora pallida]SCL26169.1 ABC-2 type transport system permease protein [Micromonospora pallida]